MNRELPRKNPVSRSSVALPSVRVRRFRAASNHQRALGSSRTALALAAWLLTGFAIQPGRAASFVGTGSLSIPRQNHTATLLPNGKVLVAGGNTSSPLSSAQLYD